MVQFYFNSCYPNSHFETAKDAFSDFIKSYKVLYEQYNGCIIDGIITTSLPSNITIGNTLFTDLIFNLSDKDTRRFAISQFVKCPVDKFISDDVWKDEDCYFDYSFCNVDAYELFYAYKMGWMLCSLPLNDECRSNYLTIFPKDEAYENIEIINFFGRNIEFISNEIEKNSDYIINNKEYLRSRAFVPNNCVLSSVFEEQYDNSPADIQKFINGKFKQAYNKNMLFPSVKVDNDLIKSCRGDNLDGLFELRSRAWNGIRVYFEIFYNNIIVVGMLSTKAQSEGGEQTSDMHRAKCIIQNTIRKITSTT